MRHCGALEKNVSKKRLKVPPPFVLPSVAGQMNVGDGNNGREITGHYRRKAE